MENESQNKSEQNSEFKRHIVIARFVIFAVCLLSFATITTVKSLKISMLSDQQVARVWRDKGTLSSQVSVFFDTTRKVDEMTVKRLKHSLLVELVDIISDTSYNSDDLSRTPFYMAYSGKGSIVVASDYNTENEYAVYGVGEDFFTFHNLELISGDYFYADEFNDEYVLLDSVSAFKLFGSSDITGEKVYINKKKYTVSGVYRVANDKLTKKADAANGFLFMPYSALKRDGTVEGITCIEVAGESPTEDYLLEKVNESMKGMFQDSEFDSVKNTDRYGLLNTIKNLKSYFYRSMRNKSVTYPYWENIARAREDIYAFWFVVQVFLLVIVILMATVFIGYKYSHRSWNVHSIFDFFYNVSDKIRAKKRNRLIK